MNSPSEFLDPAAERLGLPDLAAERLGLPDLAAKRLGGMVLEASDEFFAPKESLLNPEPPVFDPRRYTDRGKQMDGWETRRRRDGGHDWCVIRLGVPGVVRSAVVDTAHFTGNYPESCSLEGALDPAGEWHPLLERAPLEGDSRRCFTVDSGLRVSYVRFNIFPDGGVARLRVRGEPLVDLRASAGPLDLAATLAGGRVLDCSDRFFSSPANLLAPGDARDMGDGWETRRRRGLGHDWVVIQLAAQAVVERIEIDTTHFKGNYPDHCTLEAANGGTGWRELVPATKLAPHQRHVLAIRDAEPAAQVRLNIHPDGGVARLRVYGRLSEQGLDDLGLRLLNAQTPARAQADLIACCASTAWARRVAGGRPYASAGALAESADEVWWGLSAEDWHEAFAGHPRIGERSSERWSQAEQAGTAEADAATLEALADANRAYEQRFGHVFLICATGRSAGEMVAALRERMDNDAQTELRVAAEQQRQITRLRLRKLLHEGVG